MVKKKRRHEIEDKREIVRRHLVDGVRQSDLERELGNKSMGQVSSWVRAYRKGKLGEPFEERAAATTRAKAGKRRARAVAPEAVETAAQELPPQPVPRQELPVSSPPEVAQANGNGNGHAGVGLDAAIARERDYVQSELDALSREALVDVAKEVAGAHIADKLARLDNENTHMRALLKLHL